MVQQVQKCVPASACGSQAVLCPFFPCKPGLPTWSGQWQVVLSLEGGRRRGARVFLPVTSALGGIFRQWLCFLHPWSWRPHVAHGLGLPLLLPRVSLAQSSIAWQPWEYNLFLLFLLL